MTEVVIAAARRTAGITDEVPAWSANQVCDGGMGIALTVER